MIDILTDDEVFLDISIRYPILAEAANDMVGKGNIWLIPVEDSAIFGIEFRGKMYQPVRLERLSFNGEITTVVSSADYIPTLQGGTLLWMYLDYFDINKMSEDKIYRFGEGINDRGVGTMRLEVREVE